MVGHRALEVAGHAVELEDVHQEVGQLVGAGGEPLDALERRRIVAEQLGVMGADHAAAGAGGGDDVVEALEFRQGLFRQGEGGGAVARVVGRLAAAGLRLRHLDGATAVLEQADGGKGDAGLHKIGETGDEEGDAHVKLLHALPPPPLAGEGWGEGRPACPSSWPSPRKRGEGMSAEFTACSTERPLGFTAPSSPGPWSAPSR
ncbi:MAG: hypothetical protein MOGDAGHF_01699 [Rhodocyclaceae bacterium]|nr:hypothetical protein [Rhodocyclaceae bacterium]